MRATDGDRGGTGRGAEGKAGSDSHTVARAGKMNEDT